MIPVRIQKKRKGFNLIEAAIVLGVVGLVIGGIWVAAAKVSLEMNVQEDYKAIMYVIDKNHEYYKTARGVPYSGDMFDYPDFFVPTGYTVGGGGSWIELKTPGTLSAYEWNSNSFALDIYWDTSTSAGMAACTKVLLLLSARFSTNLTELWRFDDFSASGGIEGWPPYSPTQAVRTCDPGVQGGFEIGLYY